MLKNILLRERLSRESKIHDKSSKMIFLFQPVISKSRGLNWIDSHNMERETLYLRVWICCLQNNLLWVQ